MAVVVERPFAADSLPVLVEAARHLRTCCGDVEAVCSAAFLLGIGGHTLCVVCLLLVMQENLVGSRVECCLMVPVRISRPMSSRMSGSDLEWRLVRGQL